jgi:hypothetical protein
VALLLTLLVASGSGLAQGRDGGADGRYSERRSSHFVLFQDVDIDRSSGLRGSRRFEQDVLAVLERAREDLQQRLDLRLERPVQVIVHDPAIFDRAYLGLFRFSAAGFYHGSIQVRGDVQVTLPLERVLRHELVHAAFDAEAPAVALPAWINEGVAEWFEQRSYGKRHLSRGELATLQQALAAGVLPFISQLSTTSFGHLAPSEAGLAYLESYALIDYLVRRSGERGLAEFIEALLRFRSSERALQRVYRLDLHRLEQSFRSELQ